MRIKAQLSAGRKLRLTKAAFPFSGARFFRTLSKIGR